jgi:hypothetical protein
MRYVQHAGDTILKAEPHGNQGIDAAHQQTGNDYIQYCYNHYDGFLSFFSYDSRLS